VDTTWHLGDVSVNLPAGRGGAMPPSVLYPHVPLSTWAEIPGALTADACWRCPSAASLCATARHAVLFDLGAGRTLTCWQWGVTASRALCPWPWRLWAARSTRSPMSCSATCTSTTSGGPRSTACPCFSEASTTCTLGTGIILWKRGADEAVRRKVDPLRDVVNLWEATRFHRSVASPVPCARPHPVPPWRW